MYTYKAKIRKIHDADTFFVDVDLGFFTHKGMWLRLAGVDAPELATPEGKAALRFAEEWFAGSNHDVVISTERDRNGSERQTFGRYVAHLRNEAGESLAEVLVAAGHGKARKA